MTLIKANNIKEVVEMNVAEEVYAELEKRVEELLKKAEERARENGRRTIFKRDL